jgi:uncharacterized protein DUF222
MAGFARGGAFNKKCPKKRWLCCRTMTSSQLNRNEIDHLADAIAVHAARLDAATHGLLALIRRFDDAGGWAVQGAKSCAYWLSWRIGIGLVAARDKVRVAHALERLPLVDAALERGELSYAKVRAITRVATADNQSLLLDMARGATGAQLERICGAFGRVVADHRDAELRHVRRRAAGGGRVCIEMCLLADEADRVWAALRETRATLDRGMNDSAESSPASRDSAESSPSRPTLADAAVAMAETQLARLEEAQPAIRAAAQRRQLFVHLGEQRFGDTTTWTAELPDGTTLPGATLLRLACDSGLAVTKTNASGVALDLGRRRRTVSPSLLRALLVRDRRCCFPGCTQTLFVEAHHIEHWIDGGTTSLANLALVCHGHHVALHEGGLRMVRHADGLAFFDADGRAIEAVPRAPHVGDDSAEALARQLEARGLHVDASTSLPRWDGSPADVGAAVGALVWRRERASAAARP